jgi:hypothetical protein
MHVHKTLDNIILIISTFQLEIKLEVTLHVISSLVAEVSIEITESVGYVHICNYYDMRTWINQQLFILLYCLVDLIDEDDHNLIKYAI